MVDTGDGPRVPGEDDQLVAHLVRSLAPLTAPDMSARDRMRERILAGLEAARPTATPTATVTVARPPSPTQRQPVQRQPVRGSRAQRTRPEGADRGASRPGDLSRRGLGGARGRFAVAAVAVLALVFSLSGMSLLLARDALPGDPLYGIKRTAEAASLGLTFGDESKALKHLEFAAARVTEIETLAQRYPNPADAPVGGYLTALSDFDNDASAGSRQLVALATRGDGRQLESLRAWARQQASRLGAVAPRLPGAARNRQSASLGLLDKIAARADGLLARMQCYQITTGSSDDVGALPATGECERVPGVPQAPGGPTTDPDGRTVTPNGPILTSVPAPGLPSAAPPPSAPGAAPGATVPTVPTEPVLPGLPGITGTQSQPPPIVIPLPLPTVQVPPLLPGLPEVRIGG
jgi:hypothetical protein